jgi:hypothetical protein
MAAHIKLFLLCVTLSAFAQAQPGEEPHIACVKSLAMPSYPLIAKQARAAGVYVANLTIGPTGRATGIVIEARGKGNMAQLFIAAVDAKLRAAQFDVGCQGKTVRLEFSFEFHDELPPVDNGPDSVLFRGPNVFVIASPPQLIKF